MKRKILVEQEVEITLAVCQIFARYWEDSEVNGVEDDAEYPKMPCIENVEPSITTNCNSHGAR